MKSLNEVIKANECCDHGELDSKCEDCPYNGIGACCAERESDALYYLEKYRDNYEARNDQVKRYQKAAQQCEEVLKDYIALKQIALRRDNPPLTWDELKQMEGKPVWIEGPFITEGPHWIIVGPSHLFNGKIVGYGKTWQAYRKERYETN